MARDMFGCCVTREGNLISWNCEFIWVNFEETYASYTVDKRPPGKRTGTVHRLAIVLRAPRSAVYVDVIRIQSQRPGFDGVVNRTIEHSNA